MNCAECKEILVAYLEGLLDGRQKQAVSEHLKDCLSCQVELRELTNLRERLVDNGKVLAQSNLEDEVLNRIVREQNVRLKAAAKVGKNLQLRNMIMKSPITKIAVAAVVIIACFIGLSLWRGTESGIALADVLARIEQVRAYSCKWSVKITGEGAPGKPINYEVHATDLISEEHGRKSIREERDPNGGESWFQEEYYLPQKKTKILIRPKQKKYSRTEFEDMFEGLQEDPRTWMIKEILECKYESLGRSTVDGIEVEGFQRTERVKGDPVDWKIWVDVKTRLPVRWEEDNMGGEMRTRIVMHDFQWDVLVNAAEFEPVIPDDYTRLAGIPVKMPAATEENAIKGLKLYADLSGNYPVKPNWSDNHEWSAFEKSDTPAAKRFQEETKGLTKDEKADRLADTLMPMHGLGRFCIRLIREGKDSAYYGKIVTPKDADKVLLRWKVSDSEYRVIFGDLHAETVTAEKLAELEKVLPK